MEGALKTSLRSEMGSRQNQQGGFEDLVQNVATCDDFFVDDLLNFSNDDGEEDERPVNDVGEENDKENRRNDNLIVAFDEKCSHTNNNNHNNAPTELSVPADELANLEWLSHFVEDSFSEFSTTPFLSARVSTGKNHPKPETLAKPVKLSVSEKPCFTTPIPAKARSKRTRTGGRVWSLGSPSLTESSSTSSSSSSSSSPISSPWLIYAVHNQEPTGSVEKPVVKRAKKKPAVDSAGSGSGPGTGLLARRCSHCGVQKTPQWRAGPLGAKTLCNACGVRFKSGRLYPEYRPACSPTFSTELHSNHHRKVLEMRRKKEAGLVMPVQTGLGPPVLSSF